MNAFRTSELAAVRARLGWTGGSGPGGRCAVAGYDGSPASAAALAYATGWACRNLAGLVIVHVESAYGCGWGGCTCAFAGIAVPDIPSCDLAEQVRTEMAHSDATWTYVQTRGDVAGQLECVAQTLQADVIVVGRSARSRFRRMRASVGRRLVATTRHIVVVV